MMRAIQIGMDVVAIWGDERDGKMTLGKMVVVPDVVCKNWLKTENSQLKTEN